MLFTFLAVIAVRPAAGLAAPEGEPQPPQLAFVPGSYDFGLQPVNSGSQANLQLQNVGAEAVQVDSVEIAASGPEAFRVGFNGCNVILQPSQTCFVRVDFGPHDANEYTAQLRANAGPYSFTANLTGEGGQAIFAPASNPTDFGVAAVGSAGTTREIAVSNAGNMPGGVFIAVISGGAIGSFQLLDENCTGHLLVPAATCTVQVRFRPLSEGVKTATLSLFGEQDGGAQLILTGVGSIPEPVLPMVSVGGPASGNAVAGSAARRLAKPHKSRPRIRRRHRRAAVDDGRVLTRAK